MAAYSDATQVTGSTLFMSNRECAKTVIMKKLMAVLIISSPVCLSGVTLCTIDSSLCYFLTLLLGGIQAVLNIFHISIDF